MLIYPLLGSRLCSGVDAVNHRVTEKLIKTMCSPTEKKNITDILLFHIRKYIPREKVWYIGD